MVDGLKEADTMKQAKQQRLNITVDNEVMLTIYIEI